MVNINGEGWRILLVTPNHPYLQRPDGSFSIGCCDDITKAIYINENLNVVYLKKVLCHELVHACMYSYDIELNEYQEEILADLIATYGHEIMNITNSIFVRLSNCKNNNKGKSCDIT